MEFKGRVVKRAFAVGSKSEHQAVVLTTPDGDYVLRRPGGNAFRDPELDRLVGKTLAVRGSVHGNLLMMSDWGELPSQGEDTA
jgi:hypothetical protein